MSTPFIRGQMMEQPLLISSILTHASQAHATTEVVSSTATGAVVRSTWGQLAGRAAQLAHALDALGIKRETRVGTLAWNSARHLELYYAVPGMGAILHTINPRLFPEQLRYIVNDAADQAVFFDPALLPLVASLAADLPTVRHWVALCNAGELAAAVSEATAAAGKALAPDDAAAAQATMARRLAALPDLRDYESLLQTQPTTFAWPELPETAAAALCYTSGTTGNPKGVLYSHRSTLMHSLVSIAPDVLNLSARDTVLPVVPMFHVNAWGLPFSGGIVGCKMVMPGARLDGDSVFDLLDSEAVTISVGVPTVWLSLLQTMRARGRKPSALKRLMVGGAACPPALSDAYVNEFGIEVLHGWGMTETSPIAALAAPRNTTPAEVAATLRYRQGRALFGIRIEIFDQAGQPVVHDGRSTGNLMVRGHWVADSYFPAGRAQSPLVDGWFPTGDVANIDHEGIVQITDRSKDVIKSGGEWISSIDLENAALAHPGVAEAAAIGLPHPKWDERPLLLVVRREGAQVTREQVLDVLSGKVARWWLPNDVIFVQSLPHTATGKISKLTLRQEYRDYRFADVEPIVTHAARATAAGQ